MDRQQVRRVACRSPAFFILIGILSVAQSALAGNFSVNPVGLELSGEKKVAALRVHNSGGESAAIQLTLVNWTQTDGEDAYETTKELLATPPIFSVPAGETQVVRVGLRRAPDETRELSYRLLLQEIPPPTPDDFQGLRVALNISIPVFVSPRQGTATAELGWHLSQAKDGQLQLRATNQGTGHAQISKIRLAGDQYSVARQRNDYVLPGSKKTWSLPAPETPSPSATTLQLTASVNGEEIRKKLQLE